MFDIAPLPQRTPSPSPAPTLPSSAPTPSSTTTTATTPLALSRSPTPQPPPRPRPAQHIISNRRLHHLSLNPDYLTSPDHELAAPLLYDKCVRRFQTPAEREEEGRRKGWSGVLYADLERAEAKMEAMRREEEALRKIRKEEEREREDEMEDEIKEEERGRKVRFGEVEEIEPEREEGFASAAREETPRPERDEKNVEWVGEWGYENEEVGSKEEGLQIWEEFVTRRFLEGRDTDVDYDAIDLSEEWDDIKAIERDMEDVYFDQEEPEFVEGGGTDTGILDY